MRILFFCIFVVSLYGCGTLESKTTLINVDDDKQRVLEIMGTPDDRQLHGHVEAWQYCKSGSSLGANDHRVIWFNNSRVTGITSCKSRVPGCTGGIRQIRWEDAPDKTIELRVRYSDRAWLTYGGGTRRLNGACRIKRYDITSQNPNKEGQ